MAGRYELPEGAWPLIADLFERKKKRGRLERSASGCSVTRGMTAMACAAIAVITEYTPSFPIRS